MYVAQLQSGAVRSIFSAHHLDDYAPGPDELLVPDEVAEQLPLPCIPVFGAQGELLGGRSWLYVPATVRAGGSFEVRVTDLPAQECIIVIEGVAATVPVANGEAVMQVDVDPQAEGLYEVYLNHPVYGPLSKGVEVQRQ